MNTRIAITRALCCLAALLGADVASPTPKVVLISLDGATPRLAEQFIREGVLPAGEGLALLRSRGVFAEQNVTVTPTPTAPSHVANATGSSAARNDVGANTFHLLASPFTATVSGFAAPIGGYAIHGPAESTALTATPI